jgi:hypothetical protein
MSAKASSACFDESPQNLAIVLVTSFSLHTDLISAGSLYVLTAPRRQPGGLAATNEVRANRVAARRLRACMIVALCQTCGWWEDSWWERAIVESMVARLLR